MMKNCVIVLLLVLLVVSWADRNRVRPTYKCPDCGYVTKDTSTDVALGDQRTGMVCPQCLIKLIKQNIPTMEEMKDARD